MEGTLPTELGLLTTLVNIDLDLNLIRGKIPESFKALTKMENIFVTGNSISGDIPSWIDSLTSLRNINFSHNLMTGRLPTSMGNLPNLAGLALDNNLFTNSFNGVFDSSLVPGLRKLEQFYMENNQFTGTLDQNFMKEMSALTYLGTLCFVFFGAIYFLCDCDMRALSSRLGFLLILFPLCGLFFSQTSRTIMLPEAFHPICFHFPVCAFLICTIMILITCPRSSRKIPT